MSAYFPAFLDLRGRRCLVAGGGSIGERKVRALLDCGARVTVVSPVVTAGLARLAKERRIVHRPRPFEARDVRGVSLAIAATGVATVDSAVGAAARRRHVLVNVVDRPSACDFIFPSVLRRGGLQIAVSTGGRSPALAREIRKELEPLFSPSYGDFVERVGRARARACKAAETPRGRMEAAEQVVKTALAGRRRWGRVRRLGESVGQGRPTPKGEKRRVERANL